MQCSMIERQELFSILVLPDDYCKVIRDHSLNAKMVLPELVQKAIDSACTTGRYLSWKLQEREKGTLIQLLWKPDTILAGTPGGTIRCALIGTTLLSTHLLAEAVQLWKPWPLE